MEVAYLKQQRCKWAQNASDLYTAYHDLEWGVPVYDDDRLYEMFLLETFQAGLSWSMILHKRENFRRAFDNFDVKKIAAYDEEKIQQLLADSTIIRNRGKIRAAVHNAQIFLDIQKQYGSFSSYLWQFTAGNIIVNMDDHIPPCTELSDRVSADLQRRGMRYTGTVTIYSYLQAVGVVNDHELNCFCRSKSLCGGARGTAYTKKR